MTSSLRSDVQHVPSALPLTAVRTACIVFALSLSGCSTFENLMGGDKVDYKTAGNKTKGLEVPPDLTQLSRDSRYQTTGGTVSASTYQGDTAGSGGPRSATIAPVPTAELRIERSGDQRWLVTSLTPEQLWPQLQSFWAERGFTLISEQPDVGIMETEWAENRAKIPADVIRRTIGRVLESFYSTGERDKFRTRIERTPNGSEVYISHRGMIEVYNTSQQDTTIWQPRPADPQLEADFLQRLMVRLGVSEDQAKAAAAGPAVPQAPRARALTGQATSMLQVDDGFDRAWRRVGVALDRSGFTVEDRDRSQGIYFVRFAQADLNKDQPGLLTKIFGGKKDASASVVKYRVMVKGDGDRSTVSVFNQQGAPETGEAGQRIVNLLVEDLK